MIFGVATPSLLGLCLLATALGARHGLDADHLVAIDSLTRLHQQQGRRSARWCGLLFAAGHGCVVLLVAGLAALLPRSAPLPAWADAVGAWLAITCLLLLGCANLYALRHGAPGRPPLAAGLVARLQGPGRARPLGVALAGGLFALSLDSLGIAGGFAVMAGPHGLAVTLGLAVLFTLGMALVDGLNGWWFSRLLQSGPQSQAASRTLGALVAVGSLAMAALGAARRLSSELGAWVDQHTLQLGLGFSALLLAGWLLGSAWRRIRPPTARVNSHEAPPSSRLAKQ